MHTHTLCIGDEGQQDMVKSEHCKMFHCLPFCFSEFGTRVYFIHSNEYILFLNHKVISTTYKLLSLVVFSSMKISPVFFARDFKASHPKATEIRKWVKQTPRCPEHSSLVFVRINTHRKISKTASKRNLVIFCLESE